MYLLLTKQNWRDSNVPSIAPRLLEADPVKVLEAARKILGSEKDSTEWTWVTHVIIYSLEPGRSYSIWNSSELEHVNKDKVFTVMYVGWWSGDENQTREHLRPEFAEKCGIVQEPA